MKSSLRKLRGFASFHKNEDAKEKRYHGVHARQDELLQASQEVLEMRKCYDSLLSAAAATANSAYEFSEALQEMGTCLLEKSSLNDKEVCGRVLLILGKAQFEIQKLVDSYRVHIIQTITTPSESLLKELQTVEEMKRQCDDKRDLYKFMLAAQKEKGRTRNGKGESFSSQQLQAARDDYEEEANLFVFRLKSLKQGQSRSLLTQATRHYAAQLNFFRKGVKSLEIVEPDVKVVTEQQHIDYDFVGLDDKKDEDVEHNYDVNDDSELSFDYGNNEHLQAIFSMTKKSMEEFSKKTSHGSSRRQFPPYNSRRSFSHALDQDNLNVNPSTIPGTQVVSEKTHGDLLSSVMSGSQSTQIFPEKKIDLSEKIKQNHASSTMKFHTYVLPTPNDARNSLSASKTVNKAQLRKQLWYSSPLEPNKVVKDLKSELSGPVKLHVFHSELKQTDRNSSPVKLPAPSADGSLLSQSSFHYGAFDSRKIKRQSFSGPLIGKSWSSNPRLSANENFHSVDHPSEPSLVPAHVRSPRLTPSASTLLVSSPKINELHELPRPPIISAKSERPSNLVGHSGPLVPKSRGLYATSGMLSNTALPLPAPPPAIARSFSIPTSSQRMGAIVMANILEAARNAEVFEDIPSPPLSLIAFPNNKPRTEGSQAGTLGHL